jgi:hypothetical protein
MQDFRDAFRQLTHRPAFALTVVMTLATVILKQLGVLLYGVSSGRPACPGRRISGLTACLAAGELHPRASRVAGGSAFRDEN